MRATHYVYVCIGPDCGDLRGSQALVESLRAEVEQRALPIQIFESACFGQCRSGPNVCVRQLTPDEDLMMARLMPLFGKHVKMHHRVTVAEATRLIEQLAEEQADRLRQEPLRR